MNEDGTFCIFMNPYCQLPLLTRPALFCSHVHGHRLFSVFTCNSVFTLHLLALFSLSIHVPSENFLLLSLAWGRGVYRTIRSLPPARGWCFQHFLFPTPACCRVFLALLVPFTCQVQGFFFFLVLCSLTET